MNQSLFYRYAGTAFVTMMLILIVSGCGDDKKPTTPATTPPALSMALACDNGVVTFNVTNPGGAMTKSSRFIADYADGHSDTLSVQLAHNDTLACHLSNVHGAVKVTSEEWDIQDSTDACLTGYFQDMLSGVDLSAIIPSPIGQFSVVTCNYSLSLRNLRAGGRSAELIPNDSGLTLKITFSNITTDFYSPDPGGICPQLTGDASISSVEVVTAIIFSSASPQVTLGVAQASVNGFHVNVDGFFGGVVSGIINMMRDRFTDPMEVAITQAIESWVGQDISGFVKVNPGCEE